MDIATFLGLIVGVGVIGAAVMVGSDLGVFLNLPGFLIVIGGTFAATLIKFPIANLAGALWDGIKVAFISRRTDAQQLIEQAGALATVARKKGVLALEDQPIGNAFMRKGIMMIVDGAGPEHIHQVLTRDMTQSIQREEIGERIFRAIGDSAPAFGMIGTLVGLVQTLSQMSDPAAIGPNMAIALLTTLYGAVVAYLVANPIAEKLATKALQDRSNRELILDSVLGIQRGENPRVIVELLEAYVKDDRRRGSSDPRDEQVERRGKRSADTVDPKAAAARTAKKKPSLAAQHAARNKAAK